MKNQNLDYKATPNGKIIKLLFLTGTLLSNFLLAVITCILKFVSTLIPDEI